MVADLDFGLGLWGVYDTVDGVWLGNTEGPALFEDRDEARLAATIVNERYEWLARALPRPLDDGPFRFRGSGTPPHSFEEALERLERRDGGDV